MREHNTHGHDRKEGSMGTDTLADLTHEVGDLHDEVCQNLASETAYIEAAMGMLPAGGEALQSILRKLMDISVSTLETTEKIVYDLRPALLDDLGLVAATQSLAERSLEGNSIDVKVKVMGEETRLHSQIEVALFRAIQEAVRNTIKHSQARKTDISLHFRKRVIEVRIKDDGIGFDVEEAVSSKDRPRGLGLLGMKERIELLDGTLNISSRPGDGTRIHIKIPLSQEASNG